MAEKTPENAANFIELASEITIAWLQNPNVKPDADDVPAFLQKMHATITGLGAEPAASAAPVVYEPAAPVRSSVKPDHLVSLIDGKKYKTLKRHLAGHGLTPDDYRARYGLKSDYPMVAESYTAQRREIAEKLGLGRKRAAPEEAAPDAPVEAVEAPSVPDKASAKTRAPRKSKDATVAAVASAEPEATAAAPAKPKRFARNSAVAETSSDAPVDGAPVESPAKPKPAAAPKKAGAKSKSASDAGPKPAKKSKPVTTPAKTPRVKKAAANNGEAVTPDI